MTECAKVVVSGPRRREAVMAAQGASTKYWLKNLDAKFELFLQKRSQITNTGDMPPHRPSSSNEVVRKAC